MIKRIQLIQENVRRSLYKHILELNW